VAPAIAGRLTRDSLDNKILNQLQYSSAILNLSMSISLPKAERDGCLAP